jgi:hypothetical protein
VKSLELQTTQPQYLSQNRLLFLKICDVQIFARPKITVDFNKKGDNEFQQLHIHSQPRLTCRGSIRPCTELQEQKPALHTKISQTRSAANQKNLLLR